MCGRFTLAQPELVQQRFDLVDFHETRIQPHFNIAPSQSILTIVQAAADKRVGQEATWGFVPRWMPPTPGRRPPPINARAETLVDQPLFRESLVKWRCLIPADGFYEWRALPGGGKQPTYIRLKSGELFGFAGLWAPGKDGTPPSVVIVTCGPNDLMARIHTRMPVILRPEDEAHWLDSSAADPRALVGLLQPFPPEQMEAFVVAPLVNNVRNDTADLIAPAGAQTRGER